MFLRKSSDALDLLTEAKLQRCFRIPGRDLTCLYAGYYVAELLDALTDDYDPHETLFDLADATLAALSAGESVARWVLRFELGALRAVGQMPSLDLCVECGVPVPPAARVAFGHLDGGVLCGECRAGKRQVASINGRTLQTLAQMADPHGQGWQRVQIDPRTHGEVRGVMNHYLSNLLGRRPRMYEYLTLLGG